MLKLFRRIVGVMTAGIAFVYLLSCFSFLISPTHFSPIAILGLVFPYLFVVMLLLIIIYLFRNRHMALILSLILLPGLYNALHVFALHPSKWKMEKNPQTIRVLTWNVEAFGNPDHTSRENLEGVFNLIHQYNPDLIFIQEVAPVIDRNNQWVNLSLSMDSLGYKGSYAVSDSTYWEGHMDHFNTGVGLFSKNELIDSATFPILQDPHEQQNFVSATTMVHGKPIRFMTARLSSLNLYWDTAHQDKSIYQITFDRKRMVQHQIRSVEKLHEDQIKMIRNAIETSPYPVIYCGDMNSVPTSYNYYLLKGKYMQDGFLNGGWGIGATFHNIAPTLRIDYCLSDERVFKVLQSKVIRKHFSDHFPIITDLEYR